MAIAFDASSGSGAWNNAQSSVTWAHECSGSNRILIVYVNSFANKTTGVTYNGNAMSYVNKQWFSINQRYISCYILVAPDTGSNNIVWSLSGNDYCRSAAISLTGAKQSDQPNANSNTRVASGSSSATLSLTTTATCRLVIGFDFNGTPTASDGCEILKNMGDVIIAWGTSDVSSGGNSLSFTSVPTNYDKPQVIIGIEVAESVSGPAKLKTWNGVSTANVKTINGTAIASVKSINGVV